MPKVRPEHHTIDYVRGVMKDVISQYVDPTNASISWEIGYNDEGKVLVYIFVKYGPFNEMQKSSRRVYVSIRDVDYDSLINQLFNALTFDGSPFYWYKTHFKKRMIVAG